MFSCSTKPKHDNVHIIKINRYELMSKDNYIVPIKIAEFGYAGDSLDTNAIINEIKRHEQNIARKLTYDEIINSQNSYSDTLSFALNETINKYNRKLVYLKIDFKI